MHLHSISGKAYTHWEYLLGWTQIAGWGDSHSVPLQVWYFNYTANN